MPPPKRIGKELRSLRESGGGDRSFHSASGRQAGGGDRRHQPFVWLSNRRVGGGGWWRFFLPFSPFFQKDVVGGRGVDWSGSKTAPPPFQKVVVRGGAWLRSKPAPPPLQRDTVGMHQFPPLHSGPPPRARSCRRRNGPLRCARRPPKAMLLCFIIPASIIFSTANFWSIVV